MSLFRPSLLSQAEKCSALLSNKVVAITYSPSHSYFTYDQLKKPRPRAGIGHCFWRIVHYPKEYTVEPLNTTNLGGRDPVTGRKIVQGVGGGYKTKYHWIQWLRDGPDSGPPLVERVIQILHDGNRTAFVALVANGEELKYYLATENMQPGQLIETSREIPKNPVIPVEGNAHPLGSLPEGTIVHNIERVPRGGSFFIHTAGSSAKIIRQLEHSTVLKMPSKHEFTFDREWRQDGHRPRSGLYKKKDGRYGRKLKKPLQVTVKAIERSPQPYQLSLPGMP